MKLNCIGYNRGHNQSFVLKRPPRGFEYVMLVLRSHTFFCFGDRTEHAAPGSVFIYDTTTPHHFGADGEPFLHDWITFSLTESEREALLSQGVRFDTACKLQDVFVLSDLIKTIQHEKYSGGASSEKTANLYLQILLLKLAEQVGGSASAQTGYHAELGRLRTAIYANPRKKRTVAELAESLNLSVSYFQHLYKAQFGVSPIADMIHSRIEYAKDLLASTDYTVKMIADELCYPSDIQFIQQFKTATKQTPKSYRKSAGKQTV